MSEMLSSAKINTIRAIDYQSVHQICSGQVILNLSTAVKELVENSIDAGATSVDIRLKNYGIETIDVHDDGSGIEEKDYEKVCLKHCTSKISNFSDLSTVDTLGFRGEALSSLCALSNVSIMTRHETKEIGYRLQFDNDGRLVSKNPCAREKGTTVSICNLFYVLPVRHKEFKHNIKKEFTKLCATLQAYGIINSGVKINCVNYTEGNKKTTVVSTQGNNKLLDSISSMFGLKQIQNLLEFEQMSPSEEVLEHFNISNNESLIDNLFVIKGLVSRTDHGCGRSIPDRQFFYVNHRPCDLPKVSRLVNEIYHMFNRNQYPFAVLEIWLQSDHIDVNVTPDKRQIFIQHENLLLAIIKTSLLEMFNNTIGQYERCNRNISNESLFNDSFVAVDDIGKLNDEKGLTNTLQEKKTHIFGGKSESSPVCEKNGLTTSFLDRFRNKFGRNTEKQAENSYKKTQTNIQKFTIKLSDVNQESTVKQNSDCQIGQFSTNIKDYSLHKNAFDEDTEKRKFDGHGISKQQICQGVSIFSGNDVVYCPEIRSIDVSTNQINIDTTQSVCHEKMTKNDGFSENLYSVNKQLGKLESIKTVERETKKQKLEFKKDINPDNTILLPFDICSLQNKLRAACMEKQEENITEDLNDVFRSFKAKITPIQNKDAEDELRKNISKEMFKEMEVIGQFNLGFIIVRLDSDLFIIDQHATDEKYNFEMLQKEHCLKGQRLISPRSLDLNAVNQSILIDNIEIFRKNGFEFLIDENKPIRERVKLVSLPTSKNWTFDVQDIEELIFMLSDNPGVLCRPSRVRCMFASRACRMSTMVGSALNISQMKKLVSHMAEIEHPWNCPHGRPTMRHLINLNRIKLDG